MQPRIEKIQIFGERCSGTNYLQSLLLKNFNNIEVNQNWGLKHYCCTNEDVKSADNYIFVAIHRNVFDWVRSFHAQPFHAGPELRNIGLSEFLSKEWRGVYTTSTGRKPDDPKMGEELISERCPFTNKRYENILQMRNAKITNWESLARKVKNFYSLRYEDLKVNPESIIQEIGRKFFLPQNPHFSPVNSYKGNGKRNYKEKIYAPIQPEDLEFILSSLNVDQEYLIGYDVQEQSYMAKIQWLENQLQKSRNTTGQLEKLLISVISGNSFKLGRTLTWPIRKLLGQQENKQLEKYAVNRKSNNGNN